MDRIAVFSCSIQDTLQVNKGTVANSTVTTSVSLANQEWRDRTSNDPELKSYSSPFG